MKGNHWRQHQGFSLPQVWRQAPRAGSASQQVRKIKSCFVRMKIGEHQSPSSAWRNSCNGVHETITCLSLYCACRRAADPCGIANDFHFCPGFCWHSVLTRVHRGQVCLLPSVVPLWNRKLLGMSKWWTRSWCGYCYWVENTWNISACDISSSSQGNSDGQNFQGLWAVVWLCLDFAFFLFLNLCIWICFS